LSRTILSVFIVSLFVFCNCAFLSAQNNGNEEEADFIPAYGLGDQMFTLNGGIMVPLFFQNPGKGVEETNLSIGGVGSLGWSAYLGNHLSLGVELAGMFSVSPLKRVLGMIPITAKISYFFRSYPFEIPIFLGLGVNFITFDEYLYIGPIAKPGVAFYWNFHPEWSLGLQASYWWVPEFYTEPERSSYTRFGNFLEITFSGLYHFAP
jgi:hypothetical protein